MKEEVLKPTGIEVKGVHFTYRDGTTALQGASFTVQPGRSVGLVGPNGAGKSTLLLAIAGVLQTEGEILLDGLAMERGNIRAVRQSVGLVFQDADDQLFMPTVLEDIAFGPLNAGMTKEGAVARARDVLGEVGLRGLQEKAPYHLSGGQKKLASIATVLAMRPGALLLDEPTGGLDHRSRRAVIDILRSLHATRVIATHDLEMLVESADEVIVIDEGKTVASGQMNHILADRELLARHGLEMPHSLLHGKAKLPQSRAHEHPA